MLNHNTIKLVFNMVSSLEFSSELFQGYLILKYNEAVEILSEFMLLYH